jgi:hypothetical protein
MADDVCDAVPMRRDGDPEPIQIVPADQSVFRLPVPQRVEVPRSRRPTWLALVAGAAVVALVFTIASGGKGSAVPATTTSSSTSSTTTIAAAEPVRRPPQIGAEPPSVVPTPFQLVLTPPTAHMGDVVTVHLGGVLTSLAPTPAVLRVDDLIGGFWRTLVWLASPSDQGGGFQSGVVLSNGGAIPPTGVSVPVVAAGSDFNVQVQGLTAGDYRLCQSVVPQGAQAAFYVCATLTVIP